MSTRNLLSALAALALSAQSLAQTSTPPPAEPAKHDAVTVQGAEPAAAVATRDKDTLSVDFPDEEIKTILRNVADLFELNLVVPDTLTGKTSIKLRDVTWRQIFKVVLTPVGYTYIEEGNIIKIVSNESLQQEPVATEVFILNNAKAADIKPTVDGLVDAASGGKILIDARSNALVITERPSRMGRIRTIIDQLDKATDQVMIESKFVEVTDRDVRNIGVNWASLQNMQLGVGGITQSFTRNRGQNFGNGSTNSSSNGNTTNSSNNSTSNTSNNNGTTSAVTNGTTGSSTTTNTGGLTTSTTTDTTGTTLTPVTTTTTTGGVTSSVTTMTVVPSATSSTTTTTAQPSSQTNTTSGTTSSTTTGTTADTSTSVTSAIANGLANTASSALSSFMDIAHTGDTARAASAVFSASDFNIIISALKTLNTVKVVSNPTIVTLNNTEAFLNIGEEFPVPSYTYNSERGSFEVSGFTYKPIGVILKVTPQVNARGVIKMTLEPEVSQRNGETSFGGAGGASIPIVATRKVKTQISLQSGYTAGIGGLISQSKQHGNTKVPLLGDIPGLGRLFSSKSVNDQTSNLLIFITARTVSADGASPEEVFDPRAVQAAELTHDELPGYRAPKGTDVYASPTAPKK